MHVVYLSIFKMNNNTIMIKDVEPYEDYRKDLDGKIVSAKEAGGDYEFQFYRLNYHAPAAKPKPTIKK